MSSMKERKEDEKRRKAINKIKQLVGEEKEEEAKQNTTAVFWPKIKGIFSPHRKILLSTQKNE